MILEYYSGAEWFVDVKKDGFKNCKYSNCILTRDKRLYNSSDMVMFHLARQYNYGQVKEMRKYRPAKQKWLGFSLESPQNTPSIPENLFDFFASYKLDSDIRYPYSFLKKLKDDQARPENNVNYALGKTKQIAWFVSSCVGQRENLAHKLETFGIKVHVTGSCAGKFPNRLNCKNRNCKDEMKDFKFYLSAENSLCVDYITEKYWTTPFINNLLPIVMGGANYSNPLLAIPGSFIDASNFSSVGKLAEYIHKVDKDDELYNSYFKWKGMYTFTDALSAGFHCDLCQAAYVNPPRKYKSLSSFFNYETNCKEKENNFKNFLT